MAERIMQVNSVTVHLKEVDGVRSEEVHTEVAALPGDITLSLTDGWVIIASNIEQTSISFPRDRVLSVVTS